MSYDASSRAYLTRAKSNFDSGKNEPLFYAALELRCGVEARLKEYVKAQGDTVSFRKIPWKIRKLANTLAKSSVHGRRFVFTFIHPKTRERFPAVYSPVSPKLQKIAGQLGDYLHCVEQNRVSKPSFFSEFQQLVKQGIGELESATSGTLIAPPSASGPGRMKFRFEKGRTPSLFDDPEIKNFKFRFQVLRKPTPEHAFFVLKPI